MTLRLDTHVLLWWLFGDARLTAAMQEAIAKPTSTVLVSEASVRDMAIKAAAGKLAALDRLAQQLTEEGFDELAMSLEDGLAAGALPRHHGDPFGRMLIAQAVRRGLVIVTADRRFADYDVRTLGVTGGADPPSTT